MEIVILEVYQKDSMDNKITRKSIIEKLFNNKSKYRVRIDDDF